MLVSVIAAAGCSTPGPKADPVDTAFARGREAVTSGLREGVEESEGIDDFVVAARLNPCQCDGPPHEIFIRGRWTRTYLDADETLLEAIDRRLGEAATKHELTSVLLRGAIDGDKRSERGIDYPTFEIDELPEDADSLGEPAQNSQN
ncbi:MAG: hypothetical protein ACLFVJ_16550 [Persicimonas sp.]